MDPLALSPFHLIRYDGTRLVTQRPNRSGWMVVISWVVLGRVERPLALHSLDEPLHPGAPLKEFHSYGAPSHDERFKLMNPEALNG